MERSLVPFGLRDAIPSPSVGEARSAPARTSAPGARAGHPGFTGRPLGEEAGEGDGGDEGDNPPSAPTEPDGRDPLSVDSDPFYD